MKFLSMRRVTILCTLVAGIGTFGVHAETDDSTEQNTADYKVKWHKSFISKAKGSLSNVEELADVQWRRFSKKMDFNEPRHIATYRGYGNSETIWVQGRLLANKPFGGPKDDDNWWDNVQATYQRWESDEIADASMSLTYSGHTMEVVTDSEGYYSAAFERDKKYPQTNDVVVQHRMDDRVLTGVHKVYFSPRAEFMIISDMDDTVIHTGITNLLLSAQLTFLQNAKTRKPLTGVGSLYRSLAKGSQDNPVNPVFYVSNSAWNMYDLLRDFLDLNDLPDGPLLLRDIGRGSNTSTHKIDTVRAIMRRFPDLPAIMVGDSGQHDAQIYATVATEYPGRIKAIYIRDVDPEDDSEYDGNVDEIIQANREMGVPFLRIVDSSQIAEHVMQMGLIPASELVEIQEDVKIDGERDTVAQEAVELGQESE